MQLYNDYISFKDLSLLSMWHCFKIKVAICATQFKMGTKEEYIYLIFMNLSKVKVIGFEKGIKFSNDDYWDP